MVKVSANPILIVEDDAKVRLLLRRCFEGEGYRVTEAGSGAEAVKLLAARSFDLVTLDLNLPRLIKTVRGAGYPFAADVRSGH